MQLEAARVGAVDISELMIDDGGSTTSAWAKKCVSQGESMPMIDATSSSELVVGGVGGGAGGGRKSAAWKPDLEVIRSMEAKDAASSGGAGPSSLIKALSSLTQEQWGDFLKGAERLKFYHGDCVIREGDAQVKGSKQQQQPCPPRSFHPHHHHLLLFLTTTHPFPLVPRSARCIK